MTLEEVHLNQNYITQDVIRENLPPKVSWIKRDDLFKPLTNNLIQLSKDDKIKLLMVSHSDFGFSKANTKIFQSIYGKRLKVSVTNLLVPESDFLSTFPIGLTNPGGGSELHKIFGNHSALKKVYEMGLAKEKSISSGFSVRTHKTRRLAAKYSIRSKFVDFLEYQPTFRGRLHFLESISKSKGVICPRGNGIDTHRVWESLYLGAIPIVKVGEYPQALFEKMQVPALILSDWKDLEDPKILSRLEEIEIESSFFEKLTPMYWLNGFDKLTT